MIYTKTYLFFRSSLSYPNTSRCYASIASTYSQPENKTQYLSNSFFDIKNIVSNKELSPLELQDKIEDYLFNSKNNYTSNRNIINFNTPTSKLRIEKKDLIKIYLDNMIEGYTSG